MPDAKPAGGRKIAGMSPLTVGLIGAGGIVAYLYLRSRSAASQAAAATGSSAGNTIPAVVTSGVSGSSSPSTLAGWMQAALSSITTANYGPTSALNDLNAWLNGNCVSSAGYSAIGGIVQTLGLPPGYNTVPTLSVCPGSTTSTGGGGTTTPVNQPTQGPPNLPTSLAAAMTNNGEHLISTQWDAKLGEWLYATNKGGIYALSPSGKAGATFYGSYLGLPAGATQGGPRSFSSLVVNPDGTYTLVSTAGQDYRFTPATAKG